MLDSLRIALASLISAITPKHILFQSGVVKMVFTAVVGFLGWAVCFIRLVSVIQGSSKPDACFTYTLNTILKGP